MNINDDRGRGHVRDRLVHDPNRRVGHHDHSSLHDSRARRLYVYPSRDASRYRDDASGYRAIHSVYANNHGRASRHRL